MSNLENFNIENLFSDKKNNKKPNITGKLDIKTLFQDDNQSYKFNSKELLESTYEKREKLKKHYEGIFKKCCETIKHANKSGFTKIEYEIPKFSDCIGYSCSECINFLKLRLEEQNLDVYYVNQMTIYISWENLEKKIEGKKSQ